MRVKSAAVTALLIASFWNPKLAVAEPANSTPPGKPQAIPCGLNCLFVVTQIRGLDTEYLKLRDVVGPTAADGTHSFQNLCDAAQSLGLHCLGLEMPYSQLAGLPMPCIVQVVDRSDPGSLPHFIVVLSAQYNGVWAVDPPHGPYFMPRQQFASCWTGNVLTFPRDQAEFDRVLASSFRASQTSSLVLAGIVAFGVTTAMLVVTALLRHGAWVSARLSRSSRAGIFGGLLVLSLGLYSGSVHYGRADIGPIMRIDTPLLDLGCKAFGKHEYTFHVENTGRSALKISRILSSCTCAVVNSPEIIEPGGNAELCVEYHVTDIPRTAHFVIESNARHGVKQLLSSWQPQSQAGYLPEHIYANPVPTDQPYKSTVKVFVPGGAKAGPPPRLTSWDCKSEFVKVADCRVNPKDHVYSKFGVITKVLTELSLDVEVSPPPGGGRVQTTLAVRLDRADLGHDLSIPIDVHFYGNEFVPEVSELVFTAAEFKDLVGQKRTVPITIRGASHDMRVSPAADWLACQLVRDADDKPVVTIEVVKSPPGPTSQSVIRVSSALNPNAIVGIGVATYVARAQRNE